MTFDELFGQIASSLGFISRSRRADAPVPIAVGRPRAARGPGAKADALACFLRRGEAEVLVLDKARARYVRDIQVVVTDDDDDRRQP